MYDQKNDGFTLIELLVVMVIIGILATMVGSTFVSAQQKSRDVRRKSDLAQIGRALELYMNDHNRYPDDGDGAGQMYACGVTGDSLCDWGSEFKDQTGNVYMGEIPSDPHSSRGNDYYYWSDGLSYQLYAAIENEKDPGVNKGADNEIEPFTDTDCGTVGACNYGISSSNITPKTGRN